MNQYSISKSNFLFDKEGRSLEVPALEGLVRSVGLEGGAGDDKLSFKAVFHLDGKEGPFTLSFTVDSPYFRSFCNLLRNVDRKSPIVISLLYNNEAGKTKAGCVVSQDNVNVRPFFTKASQDLPDSELPKPEVNVRDGKTYRDHTRQNVFWVNWLKENYPGQLDPYPDVPPPKAVNLEVNTPPNKYKRWVYPAAALGAFGLFFLIRSFLGSSDEPYVQVATDTLMKVPAVIDTPSPVFVDKGTGAEVSMTEDTSNVSEVPVEETAEDTMEKAEPAIQTSPENTGLPSLGTIVTAKSYFYAEPDPTQKKTAYVVKGDEVRVLSETDVFYYVEFVSISNFVTRLWLLKETVELYK